MATAVRPAGLEVSVDGLEVHSYTVPTDAPESDATLEWSETTIIVVEASGGGEVGIGYSYGEGAVGAFIDGILADVVDGVDAMAPAAAWERMQAAARNAGRHGAGAMAISAVDIALWDLKAKLLGVALADALPRHRDVVPVYGSGGFTSYDDQRLAEQLSGWAGAGIPRVKIKVGRDPVSDPHRLEVARKAVGPNVELMVDANGAFIPARAVEWSRRYAEFGVDYFEEPVSSDDLEGMAFVREHSADGVAIAAGEYGWDVAGLARLAGCVDVLQADVTRCGGITALLAVDGICRGRNLPFSAHCAPAVSAHACCAMSTLEHLEYFHDHVRIERLLFDGALEPSEGALEPDRSRPGLGLELKRADAEEFAR